MVAVWLASSFCYYLIGYQLKYVEGDIFINNITSSFSEIIAYALSGILLIQIGLKKVLILSFLLSLAGMMCLIYVKDPNQVLIATFVLGSKFGVSATFNLAYLANSMLFPTVIVSTSFGVCNVFSRIATIFAPYVAELDPPTISYWVFCSIVLVALIASITIKIERKIK